MSRNKIMARIAGIVGGLVFGLGIPMGATATAQTVSQPVGCIAGIACTALSPAVSENSTKVATTAFTWSLLGSSVPSSMAYWDSFQRANTAGGSLGTAPSGQTYTTYSAYVSSYPLPSPCTPASITSNKFTTALNSTGTAQACYAVIVGTAPWRHLEAYVQWNNAQNHANEQTGAMISTASANLIDTMAHITFDSFQLKIQERISGGSFTILGTLNYNNLLDGNVHKITVDFNGSTYIACVDSACISAVDANITSIPLIGPNMVFENFSSAAQSVSSLTCSGTTATATSTGHGYGSGQTVTITGANQSQYNVTAVLTVVDANTFTVPISSCPGTATGTIFAVNQYPMNFIQTGGGYTPEPPLINWSAPPPVGNYTPNSGAFTTLTTSAYYSSPIGSQSGTTYTIGTGDSTVTFTNASTVTVTLPTASSFTGRQLRLRGTGGGAVISASSNVVPLAGGAAGTAILSASAGKFALLQSDGTNWITVEAN